MRKRNPGRISGFFNREETVYDAKCERERSRTLKTKAFFRFAFWKQSNYSRFVVLVLITLFSK